MDFSTTVLFCGIAGTKWYNKKKYTVIFIDNLFITNVFLLFSLRINIS